MYEGIVQDLIDELGRLPGIGPKSAQRIAFYLLAADPAEWVTFIETVASFGAQYTLNNQFLLLMQAEERQMTPTFFLPFGNKAGTSGWKKHKRSVRKGEKAFKVWAPIRRRPTEEEAQRWEAEGRTVRRDEHGRPPTGPGPAS